jgi:hypothetical protein
MLWVILGLFMYAVTSSMNMNESAVNMHMVLITYIGRLGFYGRAHARGWFLDIQRQVARMYDVFWPLELSSKCYYLAAFIAIFGHVVHYSASKIVHDCMASLYRRLA